MPFLKKITIQSGQLLLWEITENADQLAELIGEIPDSAEFESIKNERRKKEWLAVRLLLKQAGCDDLKVNYNIERQPSINHPAYANISISHSEKIAGILLHKTGTVGLDIEQLDRNFLKLQTKYLSQEEIELASQTKNGHALFWSAKEAVYKAAGVPGIHFAEQIHLNQPDDHSLQARLLLANEIKEYSLNYFEILDQLVVFLIDNQNNPVSEEES